jgi:phage/plasmid-associated DNA primase
MLAKNGQKRHDNITDICVNKVTSKQDKFKNSKKETKCHNKVKYTTTREFLEASDSDDDDNEPLIKIKKKESHCTNKKIKKINKNDALIECTDNNVSIITDYKSKDVTLTSTMNEPSIYKKMFDECYSQKRFDQYEYWISVGVALKNTFKDDTIAFELFDYYSAKGQNYVGTDETKKNYIAIIKKSTDDNYSVSTIYYYAITDNKPKCIEIMNKNIFELEQYDVCKYAKLMAGDRYIYAISNNVYKLYCYDGNIWINDPILFKNFLSSELYDFLKMILVELYFEHALFNTMKSQLKRLKSANFKREVVATYKEINTNSEIKFDDKWQLLGFKNIVYDLQEHKFRNYKYDDYVSSTTGYDWREPTENELNLVNKLIAEIMPDPDERELYLQILATCLDGKCLERFIIFQGSGRNGKGMIDDLLMIALGEYALIGNNSILFEISKTGSNPEKANIHKKRIVLFREPPENKKFENSIVKELTGGGTFSSRGHHESTTTKELNTTMIIECNKRPLFSEEPTDADIARLINIYFKSTYTQDNELVDHKKHIYLANSHYKTSEFQQQHKFALIKILMGAYERYAKIGTLIVPKSVDKRTKLYLELSCNIVQWFKDSYKFTNDDKDKHQMGDLYRQFCTSEYYVNLTKTEKRKYNKSYFSNYIQSNPFLKKYHRTRISGTKNCIIQWKKRNDDTDSDTDSDTDTNSNNTDIDNESLCNSDEKCNVSMQNDNVCNLDD